MHWNYRFLLAIAMMLSCPAIILIIGYVSLGFSESLNQELGLLAIFSVFLAAVIMPDCDTYTTPERQQVVRYTSVGLLGASCLLFWLTLAEALNWYGLTSPYIPGLWGAMFISSASLCVAALIMMTMMMPSLESTPAR